MSIEAIKAQHQQMQAQIGAVNIQIAQAAVSEIKGLARIAGLRVKIMGRAPIISKPRAFSRNWSEQEMAIMRQFYQRLGALWINQEMLQHRTVAAIHCCALRMGLTEKRA